MSFENVDGRTTDGLRMPDYTIAHLWAFGSGEQINDVQDNLLIDTCWNVVSFIRKLYSDYFVFIPLVLTLNISDTILNDVIFLRW